MIDDERLAPADGIKIPAGAGPPPDIAPFNVGSSSTQVETVRYRLMHIRGISVIYPNGRSNDCEDH
jgi:hypothetical protein